MDGKQTNIRGYYALPAMLERNIVIDFLFWVLVRSVMCESAKLISSVQLREGPHRVVVTDGERSVHWSGSKDGQCSRLKICPWWFESTPLHYIFSN